MKLPRFVFLRKLPVGFLVVAVFAIGSTATHAVVMTIDYLSYRFILSLGQHQHFIQGLWSPVMLPMMGAYGMLSVALYLVWRRLRQQRAESHDQALRLAQQQARVETAQRLTGLVVERVGKENVVIRDWIYRNTQSGKSVSPRLVEATGNIGKALQALSRVSFELPYLDEQPLTNADDVETAYKNYVREDSRTTSACARRNTPSSAQ